MKFKTFKETFLFLIIGSILFALYQIEKPIIVKPIILDKLIFNHELITEILVTIVLPTFIGLSISLFGYAKMKKKNLERISEIIESVYSKKLKSSGVDAIEEGAANIANKLSTLLTNNDTDKILWELEPLQLSELETVCIGCTINCSCGVPINNKLLNQRRIRITSIAKSLIHRRCEYLTTETRKPSEVVKTDENYYESQEEKFKHLKPDLACRILIIKKDDLKAEIEDNTGRESFEKFINWNTIKYHSKYILLPKMLLKEKLAISERFRLFEKRNFELKLKIIAYQDSIDSVFNDYSLNEFYDFAISKKRNKVTVFAQKAFSSNQNTITSYDSDFPGNKYTVRKYEKCYKELLNKKDGNGTEQIVYSDFISSFSEAENFISNLN